MKAPYSAAVMRRLHEGLLTQEEVETMPEQWLKTVSDARERQRLGLQPARTQREQPAFRAGQLLGAGLVVSLLLAMGMGLLALGRALFGG